MMLWSLNINYNDVDECALLKLLNLVRLEAWAERSGFARDGKDGKKMSGWQINTWQETCWECLEQPGRKRVLAGERTPLGFSCYMAIAGSPERGPHQDCLRMCAKYASFQVECGQNGWESPGSAAW